ncbi:hypothetical protein [Gibbsiella quercinecans]|uniref:hypothetical protein n=1 Tax=Gibbsiella quercinecans TaxID=929813 RepID=UPI000EF1E4A7|nr:hypothetical protein [Gibbsiella quercinecans]RLM16732.1 hypothetical protein BIY27_01235 [Gibbsiella quercinecans]
MQKKPVLDEARQLKRLNAATRRQSHVYKWICFIAALDALLIVCYDQDVRNITFSSIVALVCGYLWIRDRNKARAYRREYDRKFGKNSGNTPP